MRRWRKCHLVLTFLHILLDEDIRIIYIYTAYVYAFYDHLSYRISLLAFSSPPPLLSPCFFFNRAENYVLYSIRTVYHSRALFCIFTLTFSLPWCASRGPTKRRKKTNTLQGEQEREREKEKPFKEPLRKGDWKVSRGLKHAKTCLVSVVSGWGEGEKRVLSLLHPRVSSDYLNARVSHQRFEYF